jgi:uncharacterized C2H2 Zn-finger protein
MAKTEEYRCPECGVEFTTSEQWEQHAQKEHHSEPQRAGQRQSREGNAQSGPQRVRPSDRNDTTGLDQA